MRIALHSWCVSIHQFPFAEELIKLIGVENFHYITVEEGKRLAKGETKVIHNQKGWELTIHDWSLPQSDSEAQEWLENADVLLSGERTVDVFERRAAKGLKTYYMCERWFKPFSVSIGELCKYSIAGWVRLFSPRYLKMTLRMFRLFKNGHVLALPCGYWAAVDFVRIEHLLKGDLRCLFHEPKITFERRAFGVIDNYLWMRMWGYFIAPSTMPTKTNHQPLITNHSLRVLWVGRMLDWKCVDCIVKSAALCPNVIFDIFGTGPEEKRLKRMASANVHFGGILANTDVRQQMIEHDIYVLSSNAFEGWGAVVNEALDAGMTVFATHECGSGATLLDESYQYDAGDYRHLANLINWNKNVCGAMKMDSAAMLRGWTPAFAAKAFYKEIMK